MTEKIKVRFKANGNEGYLFMHPDEMRRRGVTKTLVYYDLPHGSRSTRQIDLDELEAVEQ